MSVVTIWELLAKHAIGKLALPDGLVQVASVDFECLPVRLEHALRVADLPLHHRDPFDRMLVAQCLVEGLTLVTADQRLFPYPIEVLLA